MFAIAEALRARRTGVTAQQLAERFGVTLRTIYRDLEALQDAGMPIKADREKAWTDFAGWRVNYDRVLLVLCTLVMAPQAPWSSDRAAKFKNPPLFFKKKKHHHPHH